MQKKNKYNCSICNTAWECFVFNEFNQVFALCFYCSLDLDHIFKRHQPRQATCMLCDTSKECYEIPMSNAVQKSTYMCRECFSKMKSLMEKK